MSGARLMRGQHAERVGEILLGQVTGDDPRRLERDVACRGRYCTPWTSTCR